MYRKTVVVGFAILFTAILSFGVSSYTDTLHKQKNEALLRVIMQDLAAEHFDPMIINDDFSEKVYKLYLDNLDPTKRFLLQSDVDKLAQYRKQIDNQIKNTDYTFFNLSVNLINERIQEARVFYQEILSQPFDFLKEEYIELDSKKLNYCADKTLLRKRWEHSLKYQTMLRLNELLDEQDKAEEKEQKGEKKSEMPAKTYAELEAEARQKVLKSQDTWFKRMDKVTNEDRMSAYLNAITSAYDPHSNYFPPKDKQDFDISLSGRLEGIGATL
jgi:carboxyl-terminal processing protease